MREWALYYIQFLRDFFSNLWTFVKTIGLSIGKWFYTDIVNYFKLLVNTSSNFKVFDWIIFVFVFCINVGFVLFCTLRVIQIIRKRRRYKVKQYEKEELLQEIEDLNYRIEELVNEKNQILGMKVNPNYMTAGGGRISITNNIDNGDDNEEEVHKPEEVDSQSRFTKLVMVDEKYMSHIANVNMGSDDFVSLKELTERFINFSASKLHLYYSPKTIRPWFAGLATTKIMILEGISGTGKTSLPYAMGKFFKNESAICSVQPSWRDRQEILGYLNEFTKKFNETDFLKAVYETTYREDLNFIVLDEMNLARVEYYFAEFLSIMEMPDPKEWKIDLVPEDESDPTHIINGKLLVPQNVWFIGTANRDDSTFTITDKVYDRATVLEMNARAELVDAPMTEGMTMSYEYLNELYKQAVNEYAMSTRSLDNISKIDEYTISNLKVTFGNRILKQLRTFVPVYVACGGSETEAIDYFICHKVFRKFETLNLSFLHEELEGLISLLDKIYGKGTCTESIDFIRDLIKNS